MGHPDINLLAYFNRKVSRLWPVRRILGRMGQMALVQPLPFHLCLSTSQFSPTFDAKDRSWRNWVFWWFWVTSSTLVHRCGTSGHGHPLWRLPLQSFFCSKDRSVTLLYCFWFDGQALESQVLEPRACRPLFFATAMKACNIYLWNYCEVSRLFMGETAGFYPCTLSVSWLLDFLYRGVD